MATAKPITPRPRVVTGTSTTRRQLLHLSSRLALAGLFAPLVGCRTGSTGTLDAVPGPPTAQTIAPPPVTIPTPIRPAFDLAHLPLSQPLPDLSDARILRTVAGIRPYRRGSYRLACEQKNNKWIAHNYGHGGAGVTLSWGAAELCVEQLEAAAGPPRNAHGDDGRPTGSAPREGVFRKGSGGASGEVAVLGGGVVGLSTARVLQERGWNVTVYAEHFATDTTSNVAGAQFAPAGVATQNRAQLNDMVRRSAVRYAQLENKNIGVSRKINYATARGGGALNALPSDLLPSRTLARLPFAGMNRPGRAHETFHIEPPRYLPWLLEQVRSAGGKTVTRRFASAAEVMNLPQPVIVNCLGLGAGKVFNDDAVLPIRGQLVHLEPQNLPYMLSHRGYMFPRSDVVVLGGCYERGQTQAVADAAMCQRILQRNRRFFGVGA